MPFVTQGLGVSRAVGLDLINITLNAHFDAGGHSKTMAETNNLYAWIMENFDDNDKDAVLDAFAQNAAWTYTGHASQYAAVATGSGYLAAAENFALSDLGYFRTKAKLNVTQNEESFLIGITDKGSTLTTTDAGTLVMGIYHPYLSPSDKIRMIYKDSVGTIQYWDGDQWTAATSNAFVGAYASEWWCEIIKIGTTLKMSLYNDSGVLQEAADAVEVTDIYSDSGDYWAVCGNWNTILDIINKSVYEFRLSHAQMNWTSASITPPVDKKLKSLTFTLSGGDADDNYIDKVEILDASDDSLIDTAAANFSETSTLYSSDFGNSLDPTLNTNFKIKVYFKNTGFADIMTLASITGTFETLARMRTDGEVFTG